MIKRKLAVVTITALAVFGLVLSACGGTRTRELKRQMNWNKLKKRV